MGLQKKTIMVMGLLLFLLLSRVEAWTGEIHGRVVCDVCGDSYIGPEDHVLEEMRWYGVGTSLKKSWQVLLCASSSSNPVLARRGSQLQHFFGAEVAVLCITKFGEVLNYQAFTNAKGIYTVAETMPESNRWDACLARPISSFHEHCTRQGNRNSGIKFTYNLPSGRSHTVRPFLYQPANAPKYCF